MQGVNGQSEQSQRNVAGVKDTVIAYSLTEVSTATWLLAVLTADQLESLTCSHCQAATCVTLGL